MTFKDYINKRLPTYDEQGDFTRLAKASSDLPDVTSWRELKSHMERSGAPSHVVDAGERVWSKYIAAVKNAQRASGSEGEPCPTEMSSPPWPR